MQEEEMIIIMMITKNEENKKGKNFDRRFHHYRSLFQVRCKQSHLILLPSHAQTQSKVFGGVDCNSGLRGGGTVVPAATMFGAIVDDPCACIVDKLGELRRVHHWRKIQGRAFLPRVLVWSRS